MQKSKSKLVSTIVIILGIVAIAVMLLKIAGLFDITTVLPNSSNSKKESVIDEWVSEPFGDLGVQVSFTSFEDGFIRLRYYSDYTHFKENEQLNDWRWFYLDSVENVISEITYEEVFLMNGLLDEKTGITYTGFAIPLDCEKVLLDGNETFPQKASIETTVGEIEFKVCTLTYSDPIQANHEFILIDKGGNEHLIKEDF